MSEPTPDLTDADAGRSPVAIELDRLRADLAERDRELTAARADRNRVQDAYTEVVAERDRLRAELSQVKAALAQKTLERPGTPDDPQVIADRIARLRAARHESTKQQAVELERLRAGRDRLLAECDEADLGERWNLFTVAEVRQLLADTPAPTEDGAK